MKKILLVLIFLPLLIFPLAEVSHAWQGRMGGMGDPYGLLEDESAFLIHPAKIAKGEGVRFYGDYRFTYTGVTDWGWKKYYYDVLFGGGWRLTRGDTSGQELNHNALLGASYPLGPGRMGLFFAYQGERDYYDGLLRYSSGVVEGVELKNNLDDFALRLLYGLPVGGFKLGGEVQFAYRQEEEKEYYYYFSPDQLSINATLNFITPHISKYWEALFKGSMEGEVGPLDLEFTVRGGLVFGGNNNWYCELQSPIGVVFYSYDQYGDVQGWRIGGDLWARYPLAEDLTLPFLVRVDFQEKTRDGAYGSVDASGVYKSYEHEEGNLAITVGGGVDKEYGKGQRIAVGIYYNYLQWNVGVLQYHNEPAFPLWYVDDHTLSDLAEHQVLLRLAGELELSPVVTLRMGLTPFFGWVDENLNLTYTDMSGNFRVSHVSIHGPHWGIGASLGGSVQVGSFTLEPFINAGWQQIDLDGDGEIINNGVLEYLRGYESIRSEWSIGGGLSVLFGL